ncbi:hypothetical protein QQF64_022545 [Cirrhinus molitorella]|uniref:Uncharacterized protein n=1 Tax=Cirrhinus molitorella TaxID=172907 RepID=A0ABR3L668_9TELE
MLSVCVNPVKTLSVSSQREIHSLSRRPACLKWIWQCEIILRLAEVTGRELLIEVFCLLRCQCCEGELLHLFVKFSLLLVCGCRAPVLSFVSREPWVNLALRILAADSKRKDLLSRSPFKHPRDWRSCWAGVPEALHPDLSVETQRPAGFYELKLLMEEG